jgi:hypothetical protein
MTGLRYWLLIFTICESSLAKESLFHLLLTTILGVVALRFLLRELL